METLLEQLIADFHERDLPSLTRRRVRVPWLHGKIDSIIGMRRSGKTWFLFQIMADLIIKGAPKESILYLNFEDERLLPLLYTDLKRIPEAYYRRYPNMRDKECAFFFDEIQNIKGWEQFVRRLLDTENAHIVLTGSSAKLLSREIATSLRGRSIATEIFPFDFRESLDHSGIAAGEARRPGAKKRSFLENSLTSYLQKGGFPEIQDFESDYRIRILQDYLDVVILRDLVERHQIKNMVPLRYLIRHLLNNNAGLFSVNKFYNDLKSQGISCGKNSLHDYLEHLSDAYLFFQVFLHTRSERVRMVNPRKIYAIDPGLAHACARTISPDWGHLLENFVFLELRRQNNSVEYYKTANGREVDFISTDNNGRQALFQVCANIRQAETRKRELIALEEAMNETGLNQATIVTIGEEEKVDVKTGKIEILPAWMWALNRP